MVAHAHGRPSSSTARGSFPMPITESENREVQQREIEDVEGIVAAGAAELLTTIPQSLDDRHFMHAPAGRSSLCAAGLPIPRA